MRVLYLSNYVGERNRRRATQANIDVSGPANVSEA